MTEAEEYAICRRCPLPDCDDKSAECGIRQSTDARARQIATAIVQDRARRVAEAYHAIMRHTE